MSVTQNLGLSFTALLLLWRGFLAGPALVPETNQLIDSLVRLPVRNAKLTHVKQGFVSRGALGRVRQQVQMSPY
jgi:hypothetical protein